jgi:hypothetical protein
MTVVGPTRSMGCFPRPSHPMTWLAERRIAQRRNKSSPETRRTFCTKTKTDVGTTKRRQAAIDPSPKWRAEQSFR